MFLFDLEMRTMVVNALDKFNLIFYLLTNLWNFFVQNTLLKLFLRNASPQEVKGRLLENRLFKDERFFKERSVYEILSKIKWAFFGEGCFKEPGRLLEKIW